MEQQYWIIGGNDMETKLKYELAGSLLGSILSPIISVIVVLILRIDTLFLLGMLTGLVIGFTTPTVVSLIAGSVYEKLNDEVEDNE